MILLQPKELSIAREQISYALSLSSSQADEMAKRNFLTVAKLTAEAFRIPEILNDQSTNIKANADRPPEAFPQFELQGDSELILDLGKEKQGSIVLSGHIGCFELLAAYYVARGLDLYAIARSPNRKWFNKWLTTLREDYKVKTIWRDDQTSAVKILKALRSGGTITALVDQDTKLENQFAPFFGLDAASPSALLKLALKKEIPLISCFIANNSQADGFTYSRNKFVIRSKLLSKNANSVEEVLASYNSELEKMVLDYPDQWVWWHKRWRRRPGIDYHKYPNSLRNTQEYINWLSQLDRRNPEQKDQTQLKLASVRS